MTFKVGDIIIGKENNGHSCTSRHALMIVTNANEEMMYVKILQHKTMQYELDNSYDVANSERKFEHITIEEFNELYPDCYKLDEDMIERYLYEYGHIERDDSNDYVMSKEMREEILKEMKTLLVKFHYNPTDDGLNKWLDAWCKNKADLIRLFEKHPNYNGKFQIVFDHDYARTIDTKAIMNFRYWLMSNDVMNLFKKEIKLGAFSYDELERICIKLNNTIDLFYCNSDIRTINGKTLLEYENEYSRFFKLRKAYKFNNAVKISQGKAYHKELFDNINKINAVSDVLYNRRCITQLLGRVNAEYLNAHIGCNVTEKQKTSRAIHRILTSLGVDKAEDYNKEFAKFSDAVNPLNVKRHTVISIHPVDFLTMSFGNSWSSCHTIDKKNDRGIDGDNSYRGCNSSGTVSYMLDSTSCVFYTVNASYNGNTFELEDKINRCMFHYYDGRLLQGRVYPQSNDRGGNELYKDIREIAQKVFADMLEVPNFWTNKSGVNACEKATSSFGTHYRDYLNFDNCNLSTLKIDKELYKRIPIGKNPICPVCGKIHERQNNIECRRCND